MGNLETPEKIRTLQQKLYQKAKAEPKFRFYLLYDKVYRPDILHHAYRLAKENGGAPGVDGVTFDHIESCSDGVETMLAQLGKELREETYRPQAVRRVMIPKPNGGERPLGIPCIRDRVVQGAAKLALEPIFEADLPDNAYGYRPQRSALDAVTEVHQNIRDGFNEVVDADVSKYFDTIPHSALMQSIARRISDGKMLHLVKMWLQCPIEETDERGRRHTTGGKGHKQGIPQGGVISPLLANIYMRRFLLCWAIRGLAERLRARIINYADDFVILCRGTAHKALPIAQEILAAMGLTLNPQKTRIVNAWKEPFDFLGYTFGVCYRRPSGKRYLGAQPSKKATQRLYASICDVLRPGNLAPQETVIRAINHRLRGWANYYSYGTLSIPYRRVDRLVSGRLRRWLCRRHKVAGRGTRRFPDEALYGLRPTPLLSLQERLSTQRSHAQGESSPRAGCGKTARPVR